MNQSDLDLFAFGAFRYALGRSSYIVSDVASLLYRHWDKLSAPCKVLILKEVEEAILLYERENDSSRIGMQMDYLTWKTFFNCVQGNNQDVDVLFI